MSQALAQNSHTTIPNTEQADALTTKFATWRLALSRVNALETEGWTNADYAHALLREKECFAQLKQLQRTARRRCLPA